MGGRAASICRGFAISTASRRTSFAGYGFEGSAGSTMFPHHAYQTPGFGKEFKQTVRD